MMLSPLLRFSIFSIVMILIYACGGDQKEGENEAVSKVHIPIEEEQLLEIGFQQLQQWSAHWKAAEGSFNLKDFQLSRRDSIDRIERPEENFITKGNPFYPYLLEHPEGEGTVDIYSYKIVYPEQGRPYFNPDSEVTYFRADGMRERLLFIGPSGAFEDAVWLNNEALLVVGHFEDEQGVSPKAWVIYPEPGLISQYDNPLHSQSYGRESFLTKRFTVEVP
ncbi:hypothetical protein SAMN06295967_105106 [Belliella buryatensis]|uniref:Uncharacterized protein n=1 Tax=Belliella buryatensis TaxID=1500549 RepID=A0A239CLL4_9BACT|nr:bifunctional isocitrate dehydrogenase kinase/phosphatase [Belliella buryatensis]SNS20829.1 hypothetical protein SAMN06295967_105106 [Belliella buryatensis]